MTAPSSWPSARQPLLPLVLGVTGHRDLRAEDVPLLESAVRLCLEQISSLCPNTPLVLLSPLAEGADRLVARVALDHGVRLVVPLPLPQAEYERDFEHAGDTDASARCQAEFSALLQRAHHRFELPLHPGNSAVGVASAGAERDRQYLAVGAYIVRHSHILIALWDGDQDKAQATGGTAQIVRYRLSGLPPDFAVIANPLDAVDAGPVVHVLTPRANARPPVQTPYEPQARGPVTPAAAARPGSRWLLMPDDRGPAQRGPADAPLAPGALANTLARLEGYNRDTQRLWGTLAQRLTINRGYLMPPEPAANLDARSRSVLDQYALADTLAQHFQQGRHRVLFGLFSIAVVAVLCFELYAHLWTYPLVLALYPLALLLGFGVYRFARVQDFHNKHLDYRALAEGLRVQLFWALAGLQAEVSDHYLRKQRAELEWVRQALRTQLHLADWKLAAGTSAGNQPPPVVSLHALVMPHWVVDQRRYFEKVSLRDRRKIDRREAWGRALLVAGLVFGALAVLLQLSSALDPLRLGQHVLIVLMGLAPAVAAALGGYADRMAFAPQAKRYHWYAELFARAQGQLQLAIDGHDVGAAQRLIQELGVEALAENGDWVMMHRERPPEAPKGG